MERERKAVPPPPNRCRYVEDLGEIGGPAEDQGPLPHARRRQEPLDRPALALAGGEIEREFLRAFAAREAGDAFEGDRVAVDRGGELVGIPLRVAAVLVDRGRLLIGAAVGQLAGGRVAARPAAKPFVGAGFEERRGANGW